MFMIKKVSLLLLAATAALVQGAPAELEERQLNIGGLTSDVGQILGTNSIDVGGLISSAGGLSGLTSDVGQILGTNSIDASGALQTATSLFNSLTSANPSATGLAPIVSDAASEASGVIAGSAGASSASPSGSAGSGALSSVQSISKMQVAAIVAGATLGGALLL